MPRFRYRALTAAGDVVSGDLDAPNATKATQRIAYLGLIPIEAVTEESAAQGKRKVDAFAPFSRPRAEDLTIFTADLALLLRTGARINDALELLATDPDAGRIRPTLAALTGSILSGKSFGEALAAHPEVFPPIYVALARVGEASGTLVSILEALSAERQRGEALRRRLSDALRYPAFLLLAAGRRDDLLSRIRASPIRQCVPRLQRQNWTRSSPHSLALRTSCAGTPKHSQRAPWLCLSRSGCCREVRSRFVWYVSRLPVVRPAMEYHRAGLFCRNLGLLLSSGVKLTASLRILADIMAAPGGIAQWSDLVDRVRRGGKLSDALTTTKALPPMAVRTLRLGEDSGQLPMLAGRVADFYESKLQRSLDRMMGIVGPLAIIFISAIVGGLIVSVMTALLSVNQVIN